MTTKYLTGYNNDRPLLEPAVYIHLFRSSTYNRKPNLLHRLGAFVRRKVTTTRNK
jgi:hypothetical protein